MKAPKIIRVGIRQLASGKWVAKWGGSRELGDFDTVQDAAKSLRNQAYKLHRIIQTPEGEPGMKGVMIAGRKGFIGHAVLEERLR